MPDNNANIYTGRYVEDKKYFFLQNFVGFVLYHSLLVLLEAVKSLSFVPVVSVCTGSFSLYR